MTREEFNYINDRLEYLTVNSDLIDSNVTQMDCLVLIANEYSKEYVEAKRRVCENCRHGIKQNGYESSYMCTKLSTEESGSLFFDMPFGCTEFEVESK